MRNEQVGRRLRRSSRAGRGRSSARRTRRPDGGGRDAILGAVIERANAAYREGASWLTLPTALVSISRISSLVMPVLTVTGSCPLWTRSSAPGRRPRRHGGVVACPTIEQIVCVVRRPARREVMGGETGTAPARPGVECRGCAMAIDGRGRLRQRLVGRDRRRRDGECRAAFPAVAAHPRGAPLSW